MSTSIPALFVLMICVTDTMFDKPRCFATAALCLCLAIGAINPLNEMKGVISLNVFGAMDHEASLHSLLRYSDFSSNALSWKDNYFSYDVENNLFIHYVARTPFE